MKKAGGVERREFQYQATHAAIAEEEDETEDGTKAWGNWACRNWAHGIHAWGEDFARASRALCCAAGMASCAVPCEGGGGPGIGAGRVRHDELSRSAGISTTVFAMEHEKVEAAVARLIADLEFTIQADREDRNTRYFRVEDDRGTSIKVWITLDGEGNPRDILGG